MELWTTIKRDDPYQNMGSNVGMETIKMLNKNWESFYRSIKDWKKNPKKYLGRPKLPKYLKKDGRYVLGIDNIKFAIRDGMIRFSWKPLSVLNGRFYTNIPEGSKLMQCRFVPRGSDYIMEVVYEVDIPDMIESRNRTASIDLGINNFVTMANNIGAEPIVIKGGMMKAKNQWYNKQRAKIMSELERKNGKKDCRRLRELTNRRYWWMWTFMHTASKRVVDWCIENGIDTLICGYNQGWKQETPMRKTVNQNFVGIPFQLFIQKLSYKCQDTGINFVLTEESYTSGTSFLDGEFPGESNYNKTRRKHRGLFITSDGTLINADLNGAYQIMRKVVPEAFADGIEGVGCHPVTMDITRRG